MKTNTYKAKKTFNVKGCDVVIKKGQEYLGHPHDGGGLTIFTRFWITFENEEDFELLRNFTS